MIITVNKSANPYNGINTFLHSLQKTKLTKHKMGFSYGDEDLKHSDLVLLGNFTTEEVYQICNNTSNTTRFGYVFCSPLGQASCNSGELPILRELLKMLADPKIALSYLFCTDQSMARVLSFTHKNVKHLPVVSDFEGIFAPFPKRQGLLLIGNNLRTSRNFVNQLAGIKYAQQKVEFEVNSYGMPHNAYYFFQDLFDIKNWSNHEDHITEKEKQRIVATSLLGCQITYSDSFNIAAYESAMCHIPCLTNYSLHWIPESLKVAKLDDPDHIGHAIASHLSMRPDDQLELGDKFNRVARTIMDLNYSICDEVLRSCI